MSDKTELLTEQVAFVSEQLAIAYPEGVPQMSYETNVAPEEIFRTSLPAYVQDLLADREAFRRRVASELGRLLYLPELIEAMPPAAAHSARYQNLLTRAAATRLGVALP